MRRVFFSFEYSDVWRANVVKNSWVTQEREAAGFVNAVQFEEIKKQGDRAIKNWIDKQMKGTSVTVVLVGEKTCGSRWVEYEIDRSMRVGNGLLGIDISGIKDSNGKTSRCCGKIPAGYNFYNWCSDCGDNGYDNMGDWIEDAAKDAGR